MQLKPIIIATLLAAASTAAYAAEGIALTETTPTVEQNFDSMWDAASSTASLDLPQGWRIDRHLLAPREVNPWAQHLTQVMYTESENLASNQKNGTYNWRSTTNPGDVAVGGLTTGSGTTTIDEGKTRGLSVSTALTNEGSAPISKLTISYDIEKYRNGNNGAGYQVQLFTSTDGVNWAAAGDDFRNVFSADGATQGGTPVPLATTAVTDKQLLVSLAAGQTIYLAWNVAVASGNTTSGAQGLSVDNIKIVATYDDPSAVKATLLVEDKTGWEMLMASTATGTAFDAGQESIGAKTVNGISYKVFEINTVPATVSVNNGVYYSLAPVSITEPKEYYYTATTKGMTPIDNPESYTGYVDPSHPAFTASGIYIRGEMNSWGADAAWEFSKEADGSYALYDKVLSGQFKVADSGWTAACNWGAGTGSLTPGQAYAMVADGSNITTGSNTFAAKEIRFTTTADGATLTIYTDDDATGLTKVYMVGDFNNWDYMSTAGCLTYEDGLFRGTVKMPKDNSDGLSHWMVYQKLGMGGPWGLDATQNTSATTGNLTAGKTGHAAVAAGTYDVTFNLSTGAYTLERQASEVVGLTITPAEAHVVPQLPEKVMVMSLNNSLIEYNDQPGMFNDLVKEMGKNAEWVRHTNLGKTLDYHWDEGDGYTPDGRPSAKMMIRTQPWSHIILQEQTARPVTSTSAFYASVEKWVKFIRENCPNPNAVIILPLNWEYSSNLATYAEANRNFANIYTEIADRLGVVVCPVGLGYVEAYNELGGQAMKQMMYSVNNDNTDDDRHPTPVSTYMAACMEYALIYGVDPATITWAPTQAVWRDPAEGQTRSVSAEDCALARKWASATMNSYKNRINHTAGTVTLCVEMVYDDDLTDDPTGTVTYAVTSGPGSVDANGVYTAAGEGVATVSATADGFSSSIEITVGNPVMEYTPDPAIELSAERLEATENFDSMGDAEQATLPEAWRVNRTTGQPRLIGTYRDASTVTMYGGGVALPSNAKNGTWNFGPDASDRALGGITTGVDGGSRSINIFTHFVNTDNVALVNGRVAYDIEKYRDGSNSEGFTVQMYYSTDGSTWTSAGETFNTYFEPDGATAGADVVPIETVKVEGDLPFDIQGGVDYYLAWNISVTKGDNCASAMALAIDNFSIYAETPAIPEAQHYIYVNDLTGWPALGLYAWHSSEPELFGAWPGIASAGEVNIDGVTYKVFPYDKHDDTLTYNLIFNNWNQGSQLNDYPIVINSDYYLTITTSGVSSIESITTDDNSGFIFADGRVTFTDATTMTLYNVNGAQVTTVNGSSLSIDSIPAGMYILTAQGVNGTRAMKLAR